LHSVAVSKEGLVMMFADLALTRRVEGAWDWIGVENARVQLGLDPQSGATSLSVGGGHAVFLGAGSPLSQAQGLGLCGPVAESEIERMEDFFRWRATVTQVEVASLADPSLLALLSRRGYQILEQTHLLVVPLEPGKSLPAAIKVQPGSEGMTDGKVRVSKVKPGEIRPWADVVLHSFFEGPEEPPPALLEGAIAMGSIPEATGWLAQIDDRIAGGGTLIIHNGLALICGDGTLPAFRGQGVQSALLRARLDQARQARCDLAVICTQPGSGSQRNAERQGFSVVYARTMMVKE
jgi:GNAT superfamily N-acetyltransferase